MTNRKEALIISVKLQPNVTDSQLCVISVKKQDFQTQIALHHQTYMKDKAFCRSTNNKCMADKAKHASQTLYSLHVFRCTHEELFKKERFKSY